MNTSGTSRAAPADSAAKPCAKPRVLAAIASSALLYGSWGVVHAEDLSALLGLVQGMQEGTWAKANQNTFNSVWTPPELRTSPFGSNISGIIAAWSGFAWDSQRGDLILWGGGHNTYAGNDVYRWRGSTLQWERASLPSKLEVLPNSNNVYISVDGTLNAPTSSHTYDNNVYLKNADRFLTFGGASFNGASIFKTGDGSGGSRRTGPYTWDPSKADGNKVGGTTGSGVNPLTEGGQMWQNRDIFASGAAGLPTTVASGMASYVNEGGKDVVYFTGKTDAGGHLFKYTINDFDDPSLDTLTQVGKSASTFVAQGAGALDLNSNVFVRTGDTGTMPFLFWDLNNASPTNPDVRLVPSDLTGGAFTSFVDGLQGRYRNLGIDYDPLRDRFLIWGGGGQVFALDDPDGAVSAAGWTIELDSIAGVGPGAQDASGGVLGKWHYAENLDAYVALRDINAGEVWLYKPTGWINPVPEPSTYLMMLAGLLMVASAARHRQCRFARLSFT